MSNPIMILLTYPSVQPGVEGDSPGPWPCHWHARIAQGPRVTEIEPELYLLRERPVSPFDQTRRDAMTIDPDTLVAPLDPRPPNG